MFLGSTAGIVLDRTELGISNDRRSYLGELRVNGIGAPRFNLVEQVEADGLEILSKRSSAPMPTSMPDGSAQPHGMRPVLAVPAAV
jgi:hypothetical protein